MAGDVSYDMSLAIPKDISVLFFFFNHESIEWLFSERKFANFNAFYIGTIKSKFISKEEIKMGYKKKLEKVARNYPELTLAQIYVLNKIAEDEANKKDAPPIQAVTQTWGLDVICELYHAEALEIYKKHVLIKTIIGYIFGIGLVMLIQRAIFLAYDMGNADGKNWYRNMLCNLSEKAKEDGSNKYDILRYNKDSDEDYTYIHAVVTDKAINPDDYDD